MSLVLWTVFSGFPFPPRKNYLLTLSAMFPETFYITLVNTIIYYANSLFLNKHGSFSVIFVYPAPSTMPGT